MWKGKDIHICDTFVAYSLREGHENKATMFTYDQQKLHWPKKP